MGTGVDKPEIGQRRAADSDGRDDRGVSPVVGIMLLFGMVFIGAAVIAVAGMTLVDDLQTDSTSERGEQAMQQVDHDLASQEDAIELLNDGDYDVTQKGTFSLTVSNQFGRTCEMSEVSLGTLEYENSDGNTVAYQAGGVFVKSDSSTTVRSTPEINYVTEERDGEQVRYLDLSLTNVSGETATGTNKVEYEPVETDTSCFEKIRYATNITVTASGTPYADGWASFLEDEFETDATVTGNTATITAKLDQERPFASFANIDPTIYGGLYAAEDTTIDTDLEIDRYNGSEGWKPDSLNISEDMLVTSGNIELGEDANVTGVPVAANKLTGHSDASVSSIGFATEPGGDRFKTVNQDEWNETDVYNVTPSHTPPEIFGAEMDESETSISTVESIDDEIIGATEQLKAFPNSENISSTLSVENGNETVYYTDDDVDEDDIDEIDTAGGIVHLAIDGDLTNADFDVTGEGQAYIYVNGSTIDVDNIEVNDHDRASALWVHGKRSADVQVENKFQGVLYAPESGFTVDDGATIYGALVGNDYDLGDDVTVHFDKNLRTDIPIPEKHRGIALDYIQTRVPIDVTFALDRSGSMGGRYWNEIDGNEFSTPSFTGRFVVADYESHSIEIKNETGNVRTVKPGEIGVIADGEEIRVDAEDQCHGYSPHCDEPSVAVATEGSYGSDPTGLRIKATKNFVGSLNSSDRAGAIEFRGGGHYCQYPCQKELHGLTSDFTEFNESLEVNANGGTYIGGGIDEALDLYDGSTSRKKVMILLTDGRNDGYDEDNDETLSIADDAASEEVTIHTIGLGQGYNIDEELLKEIADKTGGEYNHVENAENLTDIFDGIAATMPSTSVSTIEAASVSEETDWSNEHVISIRQSRIDINPD